jgi:hypothetical protein
MKAQAPHLANLQSAYQDRDDPSAMPAQTLKPRPMKGFLVLQKELNISKNILPKIPQFWKTPCAAFAELVQNAFRSGATEIHIQVDLDAGQFKIKDNGHGIQSMDDFLTIGDSAWDEEIMAPAGIGFYAHFRYAKTTTVHSRGKHYRFIPDCLLGAPVDVQQDKPCEESGWTEINVEGIKSKELAEIDFTRINSPNIHDPA